MAEQSKNIGDYVSFSNKEFFVWAAVAPSEELVEAMATYIDIMKYNVKLIDKGADFTDPNFLVELNGIAGVFYDLAPWIMEVQDQLFRRHDSMWDR